jgi:phosphopantothenoylcysteine decarboxylase/phosphopantothenate--cysteine ligase
MDAVVMAAAVADYRIAGAPRPDKIEKGGPLSLDLERTTDILAELGRLRGDRPLPILVGFAAETSSLAVRAERKLREKRVDLIVANDVSAPDAGFDVETNRVTLVEASGATDVPLMSKTDVARVVLDRIEAFFVVPAPVPATS